MSSTELTELKEQFRAKIERLLDNSQAFEETDRWVFQKYDQLLKNYPEVFGRAYSKWVLLADDVIAGRLDSAELNRRLQEILDLLQ